MRRDPLHELSHQTYVMIRPSPVAGIGVFALPEHARHLVETYCLYDEEHYHVPEDGFKKMDLVHFLNHSGTPNVRSIDDGAWFEALVEDETRVQ